MLEDLDLLAKSRAAMEGMLASYSRGLAVCASSSGRAPNEGVYFAEVDSRSGLLVLERLKLDSLDAHVCG